MSYHYSNTTKKAERCQADVRKCPFVHGETQEEAMANYIKEEMPESFFPSLNGKSQREKFQAMPSELLSKMQLKELSSTQLVQTLRYEAVKLGMDEKVIDSAVDLATILHAHQRRGNRGNFSSTPYIEHPLRNAVRLIRVGVKNQDVIVAAVLHDTIEDGAQVFVEKFEQETIHEVPARVRLGKHIQQAYGKNVLVLVEAVTNDYIADTDKEKRTVHEKNTNYYKHVKANISGNAGVFLVKLSDFIDNATGLYHNDVPERAKKTYWQATKYRPVAQAFKDELHKLELGISKEKIQYLDNQLDRTMERLDSIIAKYKDRF